MQARVSSQLTVGGGTRSVPGLWSAISPSQLRGKVQCERGGDVCAMKPRGAAGGKLAPGGLEVV